MVNKHLVKNACYFLMSRKQNKIGNYTFDVIGYLLFKLNMDLKKIDQLNVKDQTGLHFYSIKEILTGKSPVNLDIVRDIQELLINQAGFTVESLNDLQRISDIYISNQFTTDDISKSLKAWLNKYDYN